MTRAKPTLSSVPKVVLYCDESSHNKTARLRYMAIGMLWVPGDKRDELHRKLRTICTGEHLGGEVKWRKVSNKFLESYKRLIEFFFAEPDLKFRAIIVDQSKVDMARHGRDRELAFYKFYYELLEKWLHPGRQYVILLDFKQNKDAGRYTTLRTYLERFLRGSAWIRDLTVIDSHESRLAQLCDLFTGAVAAANNGPRRGSAKEALIRHITSLANCGDLCSGTFLREPKFNLFKIDLQ